MILVEESPKLAALSARKRTSLAMHAPVFSEADLKLLSKGNVPHHVGIIPDGNRRWAKEAFLPVAEGYVEGAETLINILKAAKEIGIKYLTIYTFSTENWKRPIEQIQDYFSTLEAYFSMYANDLSPYGVRVKVIGDLDKMPLSFQTIIKKVIETTRNETELTLSFAINYGGRNELTRAFKKLAEEVISGKLLPQNITDHEIERCLDTSGLPDPDLLIRTSGETRLSNFLIWQSSYSEIILEKENWPKFSSKKFLEAIVEYQGRIRRRGA